MMLLKLPAIAIAWVPGYRVAAHPGPPFVVCYQWLENSGRTNAYTLRLLPLYHAQLLLIKGNYMLEILRYEPHPDGGVRPYRHQLHDLRLPAPDNRLAHKIDPGELRTVLMQMGVDGVSAGTGQQDCLLQLSRHLRAQAVVP
jgi:hypothetical protein